MKTNNFTKFEPSCGDSGRKYENIESDDMAEIHTVIFDQFGRSQDFSMFSSFYFFQTLEWKTLSHKDTEPYPSEKTIEVIIAKYRFQAGTTS